MTGGGVLLIELGLLIIGLSVLARLAGRIGFSPIPLYLLGGLAFGQGGLVPVVTADEFISVGAEIGLVLLLFMLGLEYSADELRDTLRDGWRPGFLDLVLNAAPGVAAGFLLGFGPLGALVMGGITYISSSGVAAKLVGDLGWVGNRETPAVLSILVLEDLAMAAYLPVVAVLLLDITLGAAVVTVTAALVTVTAFLVLALRFGPALSNAVFSKSDEALLLTIFGLTLLVAGLAERIQVSAAVGAFLVGIGLSGPAADRAQSLLALRFGPALSNAVFSKSDEALLLTIFGLTLLVAGLAERIQVSAAVGAFLVGIGLSGPAVLVPALLLAAVGVGSKVATGWWAARWTGVGIRGRLRAGAALSARGEFSIAIAALGVSGGLSGRIGALTAAYVLVLAVSAPLLARVIESMGMMVPALRPAGEAVEEG